MTWTGEIISFVVMVAFFALTGAMADLWWPNYAFVTGCLSGLYAQEFYAEVKKRKLRSKP